MTQFQTLYNGTLPFSDTAFTIQAATDTHITITVPGNSYQKFRVEFGINQNDDVWVAYNKTAVVPTSATAVSIPNQELRPGPRFVIGGDTLSFITHGSTGAEIGVSFLELPNAR
jgi:hypothetical protein